MESPDAEFKFIVTRGKAGWPDDRQIGQVIVVECGTTSQFSFR